MREVIALAIGFYLGRSIYIRFDKKEAKNKEDKIKGKLSAFLEDNGLTKTELKEVTKDIIG